MFLVVSLQSNVCIFVLVYGSGWSGNGSIKTAAMMWKLDAAVVEHVPAISENERGSVALLLTPRNRRLLMQALDWPLPLHPYDGTLPTA